MNIKAYYLIVPLTWACCVLPVSSEVVFDGSLKPEMAGITRDGDFVISKDDGIATGTSLFHSFHSFSVREGESATFTSSASIDNIFARVTGDNSSGPSYRAFKDNYTGLFGTLNSDASLWIINPNGVVFGKGFEANINGSFHVSTGDLVSFENGPDFYADPVLQGSELLVVSDPIGFGFLGGREKGSFYQNEIRVADVEEVDVGSGGLYFNPQDINPEQTNIALPEGETLSLVAYDIHTDSATRIEIQDGSVVLVSVPDLSEYGSELVYNVVVDEQILNLSDQGELIPIVSLEGDTLENEFNLNTGESIDLRGRINVSGIEGGEVFINGGEISLYNDILVGSSILRGESFSADDIGNGIQVRAESLGLFDAASLLTSSFISEEQRDLAPGDSKSILIDLSNDLVLSTFREGQDTLWVSIRTDSESGVNGNISIEAANLTLTSGTISTGSLLVDSGDITITLDESLRAGKNSPNNLPSFISTSIVDVEDRSSLGSAGDLVIDAHSMTLNDSSQIQAVGGFGGNSGDINVSLTGPLLFTTPEIRDFESGIYTKAFGNGVGGDITVGAQNITLVNSGIESDAFDNSKGAGSIELVARKDILLDQESTIISSARSGLGGDIRLDASGSISVIDSSIRTDASVSALSSGDIDLAGKAVHLLGESIISARATSEGAAGNVSITDTNRLEITKNKRNVSIEDADGSDADAAILTSSSQSGGGNVTIEVKDYIGIVNSDIVTKAAGDGGNISIDPQLLFFDSARLDSSAVAGNGGQITVQADQIIRSQDTVFDSRSQAGVDGEIAINGVTNEVGQTETISVDYADASSLLSQKCHVEDLADRSSFIVAGNMGQRHVPGAYQLSSLKVGQSFAASSNAKGNSFFITGLAGEPVDCLRL